MTCLTRTEEPIADDAALGVAAEAADRIEDPYYPHQALLNEAALPTRLDLPKKKLSAPRVTETKLGRCKATSPKQPKTLVTSHWSSPRNASFEWRPINVPMMPSRNWRTLEAGHAILNIMHGRMRRNSEIDL